MEFKVGRLRLVFRAFYFRIWSFLFWKLPYSAKRSIEKVARKRCSLMGTIFCVTPDGSKFLCPTQDCGVIREVYFDRVYDLLFEPQPGFKIIDVGGHVGIYAIKAGRKVGPKGLVMTVEPHPSNYETLVENIRMNNLGKTVLPFNLAIADAGGIEKLYLDPDSPRGHSLLPIYTESITVITKTLDELADSNGLTHCDILKIDVEGAELKVLEGATQTLRNTQCVTVAAYHTAGPWKKTNEADAVVHLLAGQGFKTFVNKQYEGPYPQIPYVYAVRESTSRHNKRNETPEKAQANLIEMR